jgi:hypothetical protein
VTADEIELEVEFAAEAPMNRPRCYRIHAACFEAWEQEAS